MHTLAEGSHKTGKPIENPVFDESQTSLRWSRFKELAPKSMLEAVRDQVFPFIKSINSGDGMSTYAFYMKDATFLIPTGEVLASVVDQLDAIDMSDADTKGDLYEYMLGKIASAGQNGQFRTPRHIIKLMVAMMTKDVICDSLGTAGFLVAAAEYLNEHHADQIYKDEAARKRFSEDTFHGYDFDVSMLRIGSMNMMLHGFENPDIRQKDSLAESDEDDSERYSIILANPPFKGSLNAQPIAKHLSHTVHTKKTELLFLAQFLHSMQIGGRAR